MIYYEGLFFDEEATNKIFTNEKKTLPVKY